MTDLTARDIMTREVVAVLPGATLREAAEMMQSRGISDLPVVDEAGTLVGMLSQSDLIVEERRLDAIPRTALFGLFVMPEETLRRGYAEGWDLPVRRLMTRKVITADEETPLRELADLLFGHRIDRLPILRDGQLVGIVTRDDLLRGELREAPAARAGLLR